MSMNGVLGGAVNLRLLGHLCAVRVRVTCEGEGNGEGEGEVEGEGEWWG